MLSLAGRRIAIVSRIYSPEPGAASFRLEALARALRDAGATVRVITTRPPAGYRDEPGAHEGIRVRRARVLRDSEGYVRGYLQYLSFDVPAFFRVLFAGRLDALVVEPPPTTGLAMRIACALRRVPYAYYAADIWSDAVEMTTAPRFVARVVRAFERFGMRGAAVVLSVSDTVTARLEELRASRRIRTVGNGVNDTLFRPEGEKRKLDAPYLLYAGTASEVHGAVIFARAFGMLRAAVPDARLVFIGQGSERREIERLVQELAPGAVQFKGRLSPAETASWIRGAAATLASVRPDGYQLAFPTKMYASVACGTRVVYAGIGPGQKFAERPGFGWAVRYDPDEVADAMREALTTPATEAERARLATWAQENVSLRAVAAIAVDAIAASLSKLG
jgi:glycosyltransferase involved in cell wall biosynthesis